MSEMSTRAHIADAGAMVIVYVPRHSVIARYAGICGAARVLSLFAKMRRIIAASPRHAVICRHAEPCHYDIAAYRRACR